MRVPRSEIQRQDYVESEFRYDASRKHTGFDVSQSSLKSGVADLAGCSP